MKRWLVCLSLISGCSTDFQPMQCSVDNECAKGTVCELRDNVPVCVAAEDAPIQVGQSAPVSGTNQALGTGMKLGIELAFDEQNEKGGIRGRKLELVFKDDAYQPQLAEQAARTLVDAQVSQTDVPHCPSTVNPSPGQAPVSTTAMTRGPGAVLALVGSVGTPTMQRAAPVAVETGTLYFGAFTGASSILRDQQAGTCSKYIFNVRASYSQEAYATMELFKKKGIATYKNL